jgi:3'-5' exoribonuclease
MRWPSGANPIFRNVQVRDLQDGSQLSAVLLVRECELRRKRDGAEYLKLVLGDCTGTLPAVLWDGASEVAELCRVGEPAHFSGRYSIHARYGPQLTIDAVRGPQPGEVELELLLDGPTRSAEQMEVDLRALVETVREPHLRGLLDELLGEGTATWRAYREAPAAKYYHQAYRHGLLEHCLSVAEGVSTTAATFPGIDRDVAVTGALLHDIGKLDAYRSEGSAIDLTDAGKLQGEIALGYYAVRGAIERVEGFPPGLAQAVLHIILSHHGALEHGSPVVPCTREATLVHMIDNLGGKLGSFDRLEKELPDGQQWSAFDRALGAGAYFAAREAA